MPLIRGWGSDISVAARLGAGSSRLGRFLGGWPSCRISYTTCSAAFRNSCARSRTCSDISTRPLSPCSGRAQSSNVVAECVVSQDFLLLNYSSTIESSRNFCNSLCHQSFKNNGVMFCTTIQSLKINEKILKKFLIYIFS